MKEVLNIQPEHTPLKSHSYTTEIPIALDLRAAFYLFIASIPAESYQFFGKYSVSKLLGFIFIIIVAVRGKWFLRMPKIPFYYFLGYYAMVVLSIQWINPFFFSSWKERIVQVGQLLFFYWVSSILLSYRRILIGALKAYSFSILALIILSELGVPGFAKEEALEIYKERASIGSSDPNTITFMLGIPLIFFIFSLVEEYKSSKRFKISYFLLSLFTMSEIVSLGSRGGQLAILTGLITFSLFYFKNMTKGQMILIISVFLFLISGVFLHKASSERWEETFYEGKMSGREKVWPAAIELIKRKPLTGYGLDEFIYILGAYTGKERRDPHCSFLWVLLEVGIIGGLPYIVGFLLCGYYAFKERRKREAFIVLPLYLCCLVVSIDVSNIFLKTTWLILAMATGLSIRKN